MQYLKKVKLIETEWRRQGQPTPVILPGKSQGWQSLVGCRPWGHTESDTTEATQQQHRDRVEWWLSGTGDWGKWEDIGESIHSFHYKMSKFWLPRVQGGGYC